MTTIYIILGALALCGGLIAFLILQAKKNAKDEVRAEQAEKSLKVERERVKADDEIKTLPNDELAKRLDRWTND